MVVKQLNALTGLENAVVPNLSPGVPALISTLSNHEMDFAEVAEVLEFHPVIVTRLIGLANSAWSAPDKPIVSLQEASIRLGLNVVKSSAIAYALAAPFSPLSCPNFDASRFWTCTLLAAEAADRLSSRYQIDNSLARTGGMLRNLGLIWLVDVAPEQSNDAFYAVANNTASDLSFALIEYVGIDHLQATKHLLMNWELPVELLGACEDEHKTTLAAVSAHGARVASSVYMGNSVEKDLAKAGYLNDGLDSTLEDVSKLLNKLASVAQSIAA